MDYSKHLTILDKIKIKIKTRLKTEALYYVAIFECFDSVSELQSEDAKIQESLPSDLDKILMSHGDHFPPSKRLHNTVINLDKRSYPFCSVPVGITKHYFTQYYTYLAVYDKLNSKSSVQLNQA